MPQIDIQESDRRVKWWLLVISLATLGLMVTAALQENVYPQWRLTRLNYASILRQKATDARGRTIAEQFEVRLDQNVLPGLRRLDRCITCHAGIDDPRMADQEQPFRVHPGDFLSNHPAEKYGCTICHQGQGRATVLPDAHGTVPDWPEPLLAGAMAYTSCGRCHYENDLYSGQSDLYGPAGPVHRVTRGELEAYVPGAENIARGKRLVVRHGCLGCHKYRGKGGTLGPEITHVGDKSAHQFDFQHVILSEAKNLRGPARASAGGSFAALRMTHRSGERTVLNWMFHHFKSPAAVVPDTLMPDMGLSDQQAHDLAAYMLSLKRKSAPAEYTPLPRPVDRTPADGQTLYSLYCSSCHGADGIGAVARESETYASIDRPRELITPSLRNDDTLAVASDDYLRAIVRHGRAGTGMLGWAIDGGLSEEEIIRLVAHIRSWQSAPPPVDSIAASRGNPQFGRALFHSRCAGCHGLDGSGGIGVSLRSSSLLGVAADDFLRDTIIHGRPNTAMPSWKELSADEVSDLIAYLRSWQAEPVAAEIVLAALADPANASGQSFEVGRILYRANCANCHGLDGGGALGPSLNTDAFLSLVDDSYLVTSLLEGRPGTAMPAWKHLSADDLADLIRYVRNFSGSHRRLLDPFMATGDWDRGRIIFQGTCAGCHGFHAEGGVGVQLANPVFLDSVTDAMLRQWISYGKLGTPMRAFLEGQQGVVELSEAQIEDVITYLRYNQARGPRAVSRPGMGIVAHGAEIYRGVCSGCHGLRGEGLTGAALSNPYFLRTASDGLLAATIVLGREGTEMRAMGRGLHGAVELDAEDVANLVAFIRSWEYQPPLVDIPRRYVVGADPYEGEQLYEGHCAGCHGAEGNDGWAPALNNPDFLAAATDGFLQATIVRGRSGTAMRPFGKGSGGLAPLNSEQIDNVVSYVRSWAE